MWQKNVGRGIAPFMLGGKEVWREDYNEGGREGLRYGLFVQWSVLV